ncbi:MAG: hypothetical protein ABI675_18040 [Chitinophagaceae bacterium]
MNQEHVISGEVFEIIQSAIGRNENWMAYNNSLYFIDKEDVQFFKDKNAAEEFASDNISDYDHFNIIYVQSITDVLRQVPHTKNLNRQLTDPDANGLYTADGNAFTDALIEHMEWKQNLKIKNLSIMNEKNFEYLKDNLKYMGFGEKQHEALEKNLKEGKESFQLTFTAEVNKKPFEAILQFRKPDNSDMYFFNSYHASLERNNGEKMGQTIYLNKGKGVTAKEAYNLLEGRPVFKEFSNKKNESYKAWIQLDFEKKDKNNNNEVKQYHEKYGYDLKAAVGKYAIIELDGGEKEKALLHSLQKGNVQSVSIEKEGTTMKMFIEANPQYKTVTLYDEQMKRVQKESLGQYQSVQPSNGKEVEQSSQQEVKQDMKEEKKTRQKNKGDEGDSLLPKQRTRKKKGLGLG